MRTFCLTRLAPLAALVLAACESATQPAAPEPLPALQDQVWHVHVSDGQPVPALLGHRLLPDNNLEQDFLDSARFEISADGSWQHLGWYQRFRSSSYYSSVATLDWGTWVATPTGYEFRRNTGELLYTVAGAIGLELQLNLRYPGQEGVAVSTLRRSPPPLTVAGRWRASDLRDLPLPATLEVDPEFDLGDRIVSKHIVIDSATVVLYANGSYRQRIYHTQWEGPANGAMETKDGSWEYTDYGSWTREGIALRLESGLLQNHFILGEASAEPVGPLRLEHGIGHGDTPAPFRYQRW